MTDKYKELVKNTFGCDNPAEPAAAAAYTRKLSAEKYFSDPCENETLIIKAPTAADHPDHYTRGEYEPIDVIEDWGLDFHCGNAIKYIARHKHEGKASGDIEKAIWYLERYLDLLK